MAIYPTHEPPSETEAERTTRHAADRPLIAAFDAMREDPPPPIVRPDSRGRVTIGALTAHPRYFVEVDESDVVTLTPVALATEADLRRFIRSQIAEAARGMGPDDATARLLAEIHPAKGDPS